MLIQTIDVTLARDEYVGAPGMTFRQMTLGWQWGSSFVARLLAKRALWAWPDAGAVPSEWTES